MEDIDYGALFGIDEGGNEQEVAEPAQVEDGAQGAEEQEVAEPAETDHEGGGESTDTDEGAGEPAAQEADGAKPAQSLEENARYAAARRKAEAERDAAIRKAREDAAKAIDEAFKNSGLTNPYTGKPITSKAEHDAYRAQFEAERKKQVLRKSGMTDEEFDAFVQDLPEVKAAREAKAAAEDAQRAAREREAQAKLDEEIRKIGAMDPNVKSVEDLLKLECYPRIRERVRKGYSISDAYKLENFDALQGSAAAASRQAALNAARGKSHLTPTAARGAGEVSVPAEVEAEYRALMPNATKAEIQKHYSKYLKQ